MNPPYIEIHNDELRFLADAHFRHPSDPHEKDRRGRFIRFLESLPAGSVLFLLGDIFDFYFEYRSVVSKRYVDVFAAIADTTSRGVEVHFLGGNHDFWMGRFAEDHLGIRTHRDEILVSSQGRRLVLAHGDLVMPRDWGYKVLKTVIRNRAVIAVTRWIHPDLLDAVASGVSHGSRTIQRGVSNEARARELADYAHAGGRYFDRGNDAFVMGHIHHPLHDVRDGRELLILGDWIEDFTYGRLRDGALTHERFTD